MNGKYKIKTRELTEKKANMRAIEILHKYALKAKTTHALHLIESAQKEILDNPL